jgi:PGM1 C-terminal domain/Pre ATP-grasp domain
MSVRLLERITASPRLVFVNLVNELMIARPPDDYARRMAMVTPRELCTCFPGDVLVIPAPMPSPFKDYCLEIIGLDPGDVTIVDTPDLFTAPLAAAFFAPSALDTLKSALNRRALVLDPFAVDLPTTDLASRLGTPIIGYERLPSASVMGQLYWLNTKVGFKQLAHELGIPALDGRYCYSAECVDDAVANDARWKIKVNRGSNGFGHIDLDGSNGARAASARLETSPTGYLVEPLMTFVDSPSVELHVSPAGPLITYTCSMRVPGGAFTGMITPPESKHAAIRAQLEAYAATYGEYLHRAGIYGFCDLDAGVTERDEFWFTETNLRKTGGTYLDILMRRLVSDEYEATHTWLADSRALRDAITFDDALARLKSEGLAWDPRHKEGVILTSDTLRFDRRLRYFCVTRSWSGALDREAALRRVFDFA